MPAPSLLDAAGKKKKKQKTKATPQRQSVAVENDSNPSGALKAAQTPY